VLEQINLVCWLISDEFPLALIMVISDALYTWLKKTQSYKPVDEIRLKGGARGTVHVL